MTSIHTNLGWFAKKVLPRGLIDVIRNVLPQSLYYPGYGDSTLNEKKIRNIVSLLDECLQEKLEGNVIECGVFRGGSLIQIGLKLKQVSPEKILFGVDTFEGHPYNTPEDQAENGKILHKKGLFATNQMEKIQNVLDQKNLKNIHLYKGLVEDVLPRFDKEKFCFAHLDLDLYLSTKQAFSFVASHIAEGGIVIFDDYGDPEAPGVKKAVDEILGESLVIITLSSKDNGYQGYWKKIRAIDK